MSEQVAVAVIGGGQAGLAVSHELSAAGIEHLVLERGRVAQTWRGRWDSFCLVTPNWTVQLPGFNYDGDDPDGFMHRDAIVASLERYARSFAAPVREGVRVLSVEREEGGTFVLQASTGKMRARAVVLATGAYQLPHRPQGAGQIPQQTFSIDAEQYTNPAALPDGAVLVIGSGQTGCQISEELHESGREVFLACGRAPWLPRRFGGRDMFSWIVETPFMETRLEELPSVEARLIANLQASGHDRGHDLHYRTLQGMGVTLLGHFLGVEDGRVQFADDLEESVAFGDARYDDTRNLIRRTCEGLGVTVPELPDAPAFRAEPPDHLDIRQLGAVIFTSGFRPDYARWVHIPNGFDHLGFPVQYDGASTVAPGLYFVGVHFLRKRKSSLLIGVGEDARIVAGAIAASRYQR